MRDWKIHDIKAWPEPWEAVANGTKRYEIRKADRDYQVGDLLALQLFDPDVGYRGAVAFAAVMYMTPPGKWGLPDDLCVMSINCTSVHRVRDYRKVELLSECLPIHRHPAPEPND